MSETWFTKHIPDSCVEINGYSLIRKDRSNRNGGGVCFYVKNGINFEVRAFSSFNVTVEIKWIRVTYYSSLYFIACCYFPPKPRHTAEGRQSLFRQPLFRQPLFRQFGGF